MDTGGKVFFLELLYLNLSLEVFHQCFSDETSVSVYANRGA